MSIVSKLKRYGYYLYLLCRYEDKRSLVRMLIGQVIVGKSVRCDELARKQSRRIVILTTMHCIFVANLLRKNLAVLFDDIEIIYAMPQEGYEDCLHFVICANCFKHLPKHYIVYQMEQSISDRWFTPQYFEALRNALAIADYSEVNIKFLLSKDFNFSSIYFLPIHYFRNYQKYLGINDVPVKYDVVFYGDPNSERRRKFLDEISKKFNILVISEVFGHDLVKLLLQARIVVNIHYYDNALLETTRIFECLSLDRLVISEKSSDMKYHGSLDGIVDFVQEMDVKGMVNKIEYWVNNTEKLNKKISDNKAKLNATETAAYYLHRFLMGKEFIAYKKFYVLSSELIPLNDQNNIVCLSLPESVDRRQSFIRDRKYTRVFNDIPVFNGIRNDIGWLGCGLSYKAIMNKAKDCGLQYVIVCEDDVDFDDGFQEKFKITIDYLCKHEGDWDIFCGLLSDCHADSVISKIESYKGEEFIYLNKFTGGIFNVYNRSCFDAILSWDETNTDVMSNTIDRYLENKNLRIVTTVPFLVGHKEDLNSTLWSASNANYNQLLAASVNTLRCKVYDFKIARGSLRRGIKDRVDNRQLLSELAGSLK